MRKKYYLEELKNFKINFKKPFLIFLKWDLSTWKTMFSKHIINNLLWEKKEVISPTYVYYNKYCWFLDSQKTDIFHFDLYRLKNYDEFFAIGWEDILDNNEWIIIIEWPELIEKYYKPDLEINFSKTNNKNEREIQIVYK